MSQISTFRIQGRRVWFVHGLAAALFALVAASVGCSKEQDPRFLPVFPVKGKVTFKGKVPDGASLALHPKDPELAKNPKFIPPRASVQPDGTFALTSYQSNDVPSRANTCSRSLGTKPSSAPTANPIWARICCRRNTAKQKPRR